MITWGQRRTSENPKGINYKGKNINLIMPKFILFKEGHNGQMYWVSEWEKIFANPNIFKIYFFKQEKEHSLQKNGHSQWYKQATKKKNSKTNKDVHRCSNSLVIRETQIPGTSLVGQWLRLQAQNAGRPGQGIVNISCMLQVTFHAATEKRAYLLQLKIICAVMKTDLKCCN